MRTSMYEPIPEVFEAATILSHAVDAHLAGRFGLAKRLIVAADIPSIRDWQWPIESKWPWKRLVDEPPSVPKDLRPRPRDASPKMRAQALERDGCHCRFCGMPVITSETRTAMIAVYGDVIPWSRKFTECHAAFNCLWASYDHVLPNERGGTTDLQNIVITCSPCNYGRMNFTLNEVGVLHPSQHSGPPRWEGYEVWDGLQRFHRSSAPTGNG